MLQKILLLLTISFLLSFNAVAQDVSVEVQNLLYDENGNIIDFGEIQFTFNSDILPVDIDVTPVSCTSGDFIPGHATTTYTYSPGLGVCFGEEFTEYCFTITTNVGTPEECSIDFCATICTCRLVERHGELLVRSCGKCDERPNDDTPADKSVQNVNTEELLSATPYNLEIEKNSLVEENEIQASNRSFTLNKVFPNPFNNQINVEIASAQAEKATMRLFDLMGKDVHLETIVLQQGDNKLILTPRQNLPSGTYLLHIYRHDGQLITAKLIKAE